MTPREKKTKPEERDNNRFWYHVDELRKRLIFCAVVLAVLAVGCYILSDEIIAFLTQPVTSLHHKLYFLSPYDAFVVKLQVAFWGAFFLSMPLLLTELWLFIAPGLYTNEKSNFTTLLLASITLFVLGVVLAFFVVVPMALRFFLGFSTPELQPIISIQRYMNFVTWMALGFGLAFQGPVFLVGLVRFGIVTLEKITSLRGYMVLGSFIFAALMTPPDPVSQCLLALPLWLLFEMSLVVAKFIKKR